MKTFRFDLLVFGLNRNVLLRLRQFRDQIKLLCFVPELLGQNEKDLLAIKNFWTKSKSFAIVPIVRGPNQNVLLRSDNKLRYRNVCPFVPISLTLHRYVSVVYHLHGRRHGVSSGPGQQHK
jgi:hypothetical protein